MFTLIIEDKDGSIADEYSFDEGEFIVGRSHSSDIILPADNVSRRHARLYTQGGTCFVEDLGSSNGVHVNGARIHGVSTLGRSAQIKIGDYFLHVEGGGSGQVTGQQVPPSEVMVEPSHTAIASLGIPEQELSRPGSFGRLVGTNLATQGRPFEIVSAVNLIGRGKDCTITILDPSVSRIHGKIMVGEDGSFSVEDLRSSNGVYVNSERVDSAEFGHGDRVRFGNVEFICERIGPVVETSDAMIQAFRSPRRKAWIVGGIAGALLLVIAIVAAIVVYSQSTKSGRTKGNKGEATVELSEEQKALKKTIDTELNKARVSAAEGKWSKAERRFRRAQKRLRKSGSIDKDRAVRTHFRAIQKALRKERETYNDMASALDDKEYTNARRIYERLLDQNGVMKGLAKKRLMRTKTDILSEAKSLCEEKDLAGCLASYRKAKELDKKDKKIGRKIYELRNQIRTASGEEKVSSDSDKGK